MNLDEIIAQCDLEVIDDEEIGQEESELGLGVDSADVDDWLDVDEPW